MAELGKAAAPKSSWGATYGEADPLADHVTDGSFYASLLQWASAEKNYVIAATIKAKEGGGGGGGEELPRSDGLIEGHFYSVIRCVELDLPNEIAPLKLLQLRNPWGNAQVSSE